MPEGYKNFSKTRPMKLEHFQPAMDWWNNRREIIDEEFPKAKKYTVTELAELNYNIELCGYHHEKEEILAPQDLINSYRKKRVSLDAYIDRVLGKIMALLWKSK